MTGGTSATRRPTFSILCRHRSRWRSYVATENKESRRYRLPESAATDARLARRGYVVTLPRGAVSAPHGKPQPSNQFDGLTMTAVWPVQSSPLRPVGKSIDVEQLTCQPHARQSFAMIVPDVRACFSTGGDQVGSKSSRPIRPAKASQPAAPSCVGVDLGRTRTRPIAWTALARDGKKSNPMVRTTLVATSIEIRAWRNPRDLGYPLLPFSYCQLETTRSGKFESAHVNCNVADDAASLGFWP